MVVSKGAKQPRRRLKRPEDTDEADTDRLSARYTMPVPWRVAQPIQWRQPRTARDPSAIVWSR